MKTFKQITKKYQHQNGAILITDTSFIQNKYALLLADKAYHSKHIAKDLKDHNILIMIQNKINMVQQSTFDKQIYKNI
jgi:hypothetical protein